VFVPAANRHQRHQRIADQHFIGFSNASSALSLRQRETAMVPAARTKLAHNAVDPGLIERGVKTSRP
jgi:hypothetical protein